MSEEIPHMTVVEEFDEFAVRKTWLLSWNNEPYSRIVHLGPGRYGLLTTNDPTEKGTYLEYSAEDCFEHQIEAVTFSLATKIFPQGHPGDD